jgi:hypothetical protein
MGKVLTIKKWGSLIEQLVETNDVDSFVRAGIYLYRLPYKRVWQLLEIKHLDDIEKFKGRFPKEEYPNYFGFRLPWVDENHWYHNFTGFTFYRTRDWYALKLDPFEL